MFKECKLLSYLPDISKWNISKVTNYTGMFNKCKSLSLLPDFSKWINIIKNKCYFMFAECESLSFLPNVFNVEKTNSLIQVSIYNSNMYMECFNCLNLYH